MGFCGVPTVVLVFLLLVLAAIYVNASQTRGTRLEPFPIRVEHCTPNKGCTPGKITPIRKPVQLPRPQGPKGVRFVPIPLGKRSRYPWKPIKIGRGRRPGGLSHESTNLGLDVGLPSQSLTRRQLKSAKKLAKKIRQFGSNLFRKEASIIKNDFLLAPVELHRALTMMSAGAQGKTLRQLQKILGTRSFRGKKVTVHHSHYYLRKYLSTINNGPQFHTALGLFVKPHIPLEMSFLRKVSHSYTAQFDRISPKSVENINSWISSATDGVFPALLPPNSIKPKTEMVLTSALCMNASWEKRFPEGLTEPRPFNSLSGKTEYPLTMKQTGIFKHMYTDRRQIIQIPLSTQDKKRKLVLDIVDFRNSTTMDSATYLMHPGNLLKLNEITSKGVVTLYMPRFEIQSDVKSLEKQLKKLGVRKAFRKRKANFQGISSSPGLYIEKLFHQGALQVNEYGIGCLSSQTGEEFKRQKGSDFSDEGQVIRLDSPFFFGLREMSTHIYLFMGLYTGNT